METSPILKVITLRLSSWSVRALLPLLHAEIPCRIDTVSLPLEHQRPGSSAEETAEDIEALVEAGREKVELRRRLGSVTGYFPVLHLGDIRIHEALAIAEWAAETKPSAGLWPSDPLKRAQARALAHEMSSGFLQLRGNLSCHFSGRVPNFKPNAATLLEIERVFELIEGALTVSKGPFLFGRFTITDAFYFPVLSRFATYGIPVPTSIKEYGQALLELPALAEWRRIAQASPSIPVYDDYIRSLGGDPEGADWNNILG